MKSYHEKLMQLAPKIDKAEIFWKRPHTPRKAMEKLFHMRQYMKQLIHIWNAGNEEERQLADLYAIRLEILFTTEVTIPKYVPFPKGFYDDS